MPIGRIHPSWEVGKVRDWAVYWMMIVLDYPQIWFRECLAVLRLVIQLPLLRCPVWFRNLYCVNVRGNLGDWSSLDDGTRITLPNVLSRVIANKPALLKVTDGA